MPSLLPGFSIGDDNALEISLLARQLMRFFLIILVSTISSNTSCALVASAIFCMEPLLICLVGDVMAFVVPVAPGRLPVISDGKVCSCIFYGEGI